MKPQIQIWEQIMKLQNQMNNNELGKLKTFCQLLDEENTIIIPKVQRDYAYGRVDLRVTSVLDGMLTNILKAVCDNESIILDFVYGGSYVKKNKVVAGLIPLDGQQRLTTLFLLYFYASLIGDEGGKAIDEAEVVKLTKFRYETRQSATEFCTNLILNIRQNLLLKYQYENQNLKELIVDNALYLSTYDCDPTIISMLNVLDKIEKKCIEFNVNKLSPCLWKRLTERINIQFYKLSLENFGLTDDLFIKMNARGKKLTEFEVFKSDIMSTIKCVSEELKDTFSIKMDTEWIDIVWDYTDKAITDKRNALDITNEADKKFSILFQNIFKLEFYRRDLSSLNIQESSIRNILSDEGSIKSVMDIFDTFYSIHKKIGFKKLWYEYFYFDDDVVGKDNYIRLFWKQKRMSVFELALSGTLSVPEMVYFYSVYLLYKKGYDKDTTKRCLRIIHNLMTGNVRAVDARTDKLPGFLTEIKYIIDCRGVGTFYDKETGLIIDGENHKLSFLQNVWNEEFVKQNHLSSNDYESLMRYENHDILRCSLSLFMEYTIENDGLVGMKHDVSPIDATKLLNLLNKFESLFGNDYYGHFNKLSTLFLDKKIEYMQFDPYMDRNDKRRYFLTTASHLSDFFIKSNNRKNQINILQILDKINIPENFSLLDDSYKNFSSKDWKYYMAKYRSRCFRENSRYGIGVWNNLKEYPLDIIMLNSSQHSESNLEWMMLTNILWTILGNNNVYRLDDHGCSPIVITTSASSIGFYKGKWNIETELDIAKKVIENHQDWVITCEENKYYTVDYLEGHEDHDYIELGQSIVSLLESIQQSSVIQ